MSFAERWNELFAVRDDHRYRAEDNRLFQAQDGVALDKPKLIKRILTAKSRNLDPPEVFLYPMLRRFLDNVNKTKLRRPLLGTFPNEVVLLDERRDTLTDGKSPKPWDMEGDPGYLSYPETGERGNGKVSRAISLDDLLTTLSSPVSNLESESMVFLVDTRVREWRRT
jgi:hypothetical protein